MTTTLTFFNVPSNQFIELANKYPKGTLEDNCFRLVRTISEWFVIEKTKIELVWFKEMACK
jgi:hypothetical protein